MRHDTRSAGRVHTVGDGCGDGLVVEYGKYSVNVVPTPGLDSSAMPPPACSTIPYTVDSPRPVPRPSGFVVKYGSNARAIVSLSMPVPVSPTARRAYRPAERRPVVSLKSPTSTMSEYNIVADAWTAVGVALRVRDTT